MFSLHVGLKCDAWAVPKIAACDWADFVFFEIGLLFPSFLDFLHMVIEFLVDDRREGFSEVQFHFFQLTPQTIYLSHQFIFPVYHQSEICVELFQGAIAYDHVAWKRAIEVLI